VETVWNWLGARGAQEVDALTRRYAPCLCLSPGGRGRNRRALPGQLGGGGIVARRGVVVEAVLDAGVDVVLVIHGFLQRLS
jgi:hypothetical protein